jgi:exodeoxyribonuclease VII small subunit
MTDKKPAPDFEQSLNRLEQLVREMEGGQLSLEKMMAHFEEGMGLVKSCGQKLNEVEAKIEMLVKKGDKLVAQPLPPDEGAPKG